MRGCEFSMLQLYLNPPPPNKAYFWGASFAWVRPSWGGGSRTECCTTLHATLDHASYDAPPLVLAQKTASDEGNYTPMANGAIQSCVYCSPEPAHHVLCATSLTHGCIRYVV